MSRYTRQKFQKLFKKSVSSQRYATLIVLADGDDKKKSEESDNSDVSISKKGDSKGSGKAESVASDKEESSAPTPAATVPQAAGAKSKQDEDGNKRLVSIVNWFKGVLLKNLPASR